MDPAVLIVGADSMLGIALASSLRARGTSVIGSTRRPCGTAALLQLDLARDVSGWAVPRGIETAIILAAVTDQRRCQEEPQLSQRVNVEGTLALARRLIDGGVRVVFPSTNLVLGGLSPCQSAQLPYAPLSLYAKQKAETEQGLLAMAGSVAVCRLAKVVDFGMPLIAGWKADLAAGRRVRAFSDLRISPVSLRYTIEFLARALASRENGIFQISGAEEVSYCDFARALARRIGRSDESVECVSGKASVGQAVGWPDHPSLDGSRTERVLGLPPQTLPGLLDDMMQPMKTIHASTA